MEPVLTLSPKARKRVLEIRSNEADGDKLALWVEVVGVTHGDYAYDLYFDAPGEADEADVVQQDDDLTVVIPFDSAEVLKGANLEMSRDLLNPGLIIVNPNKPPAATVTFDGPPPELSGSVAERVAQVIEHYINPNIAAHGGQASLVAVEDDTAYVRLGGGCAGCGMAPVTLSQGIDRVIRETVPEIQKIVDVTDHAAGTNPYYEPEPAGHGHSH